MASGAPGGAPGAEELFGLVAGLGQRPPSGRRPPEAARAAQRGEAPAPWSPEELPWVQQALAHAVSAEVLGRGESLPPGERGPASGLGGLGSAQAVELNVSALTAVVLAAVGCGAFMCVIFTVTVGPIAVFLLYCWAWAVWLSHWATPCDRPLDAWLGLYLLYTVLVCRLMQVSARTEAPLLTKFLKLVNGVFPFAWMVLGKVLLARSTSCPLAAPALYGFASWFSWAFLALHSAQLLWLGISLAGVPLLLFLARRGSLHPALLFLARHGLLRNSGGAGPGAAEQLELVEYRPELFADPSVPSDPRPQGECCICLQAYDASATIRRTPCGHLMHHECLAMWLQTARTCPTCRGNLDPLSSSGVVIV